MNILYFINAVQWGGAEKYILDLASCFSREHNVYVLLPAQGKKSMSDLTTDLPASVQCREFDWEEGQSALKRAVAKEGIALVHLNIPHFSAYNYGWYARDAKKGGARSVTGTIHLTSNWCSWKNTIQARLFSRYVDQFIAVSNAVKEGVIRHHHIPERKIQTVYNGIYDIPVPSGEDVNRIKDSIDYRPERAYFLSIGRLSPQKGHKDLLAAVQKMEKKGKEFEVLILGDGELRKELENSVRKTGMENRVRFCGHTRNVPAYLAFASGAVFTSKNEGFPYTAIECFSQRVPVIAYDIPSMRETLQNGKCGFLVDFGDVEGLASVLDRLMDGEHDIEHRTEEAFTFYTQSLRVSVMTKRVEQIYQSLLPAG